MRDAEGGRVPAGADGVAGLTIARSTGFWGALSQPQDARRYTTPAKSLRRPAFDGLPPLCEHDRGAA